jgi:hypothetical protein
MKRIFVFCSIALSMLLVFSSCGVMFGGSKYQGKVIVKDHPNAEIFINGKKTGMGESTNLYPRDMPLVVEVKQEGCPTKTQTFQKTFRTGNFILSIVSFGLVGLAVDLGTGASYKPAHNSDSAIKKLSDKNYEFTVDYSECKTTN